jgi:hypothetical protein
MGQEQVHTTEKSNMAKRSFHRDIYSSVAPESLEG